MMKSLTVLISALMASLAVASFIQEEGYVGEFYHSEQKYDPEEAYQEVRLYHRQASVSNIFKVSFSVITFSVNAKLILQRKLAEVKFLMRIDFNIFSLPKQRTHFRNLNRSSHAALFPFSDISYNNTVISIS